VNHESHLHFEKALCVLCNLPPGAQGVVREVRGDAYLITTLASLGLTAGAELSVLRNAGHGPLLISVRDTRLALGRSEAAWIEVEPIAAGDEHEPDR
jgi:ferrous iron transport protein A